MIAAATILVVAAFLIVAWLIAAVSFVLSLREPKPKKPTQYLARDPDEWMGDTK